MTTTHAKLPLIQKLGYIFIGILIFAVLALAIVQIVVFSMAENVPAFGSVPADSRGWPAEDKRGAFLLLNQPHNPAYPGDLLELLATTQAGVVDEKAGAHLLPGEIKSILIQTAAMSENGEYKVYRLAVPEDQKMVYKRQPGGKVLLIENSAGAWAPGTYIVDVPSEGMFGGRTYFQFYVDSSAPTPATK
jgi:hypothetical protein